MASRNCSGCPTSAWGLLPLAQMVGVVLNFIEPSQCLLTHPKSGCVRLWDPSISSNDEPQKNCTIIAEVDADISAFSLGERGTKEHTLMVYVGFPSSLRPFHRHSRT